MGFAYVLGKPVYLLNPVPDIPNYFHEMKAMETLNIDGDLTKLDI
jgi:hypothetical protein